MTLNELFQIRSALESSVKFEVDEALKIVNKEIELKTMDPRKAKIDLLGNLIEE